MSCSHAASQAWAKGPFCLTRQDLSQAVLEKFGAAEDPLLPGHPLLEQFQAQFVSALRCVSFYEF